MSRALDALVAIAWVLLLVAMAKSVALGLLAHAHARSRRRTAPTLVRGPLPLVSVLVPCFNEELTLRNSVQSLLAQTYPAIEIVVVDDGSTDGTRVIARDLASLHSGRIRFLSQANGGKARALNTALAASRGEIVVCMDADSVLDHRAVAFLVDRLRDPTVVAVGGNVKVANRHGLLGLQQALEYVAGLNLQRRALAHLGAMQVISGAIGAFRRDALRAVGGFPADTIVEDMDVTVALALAGGRIDFEGRAVAYTEAPDRVGSFGRQRFRWIFGGFQVLSKHRGALFRGDRGRIGSVGLPYFLVFPWLDVAVSFLFVLVVLRLLVDGSVEGFLVFYACTTGVNLVLMLCAIRLDGDESRALAALALVDGLWYAHLISLVTLRAGVAYVRGRVAAWDKLERRGENRLPARLAGPVPVARSDRGERVIDLRDPVVPEVAPARPGSTGAPVELLLAV